MTRESRTVQTHTRVFGQKDKSHVAVLQVRNGVDNKRICLRGPVTCTCIYQVILYKSSWNHSLVEDARTYGRPRLKK